MTNAFEKRVVASEKGNKPLRCRDISTLQVNVTLRCNQECSHCHLAAGPGREEHMGAETVESVLLALDTLRTPTVDITGGAPELNENLPRLVEGARERDCPVMVRTNLTALGARQDLATFFADHQVKLVASLPCYMRDNVEKQRGKGVYDQSIRTLRRLNELGYGCESSRELDLVYNPAGAFLPPAQGELERDYRSELKERYGLEFTHLLTIANMPIGRFGERLQAHDQMENYQQVLQESFNPETVESLMCLHQVTVGPDGTLYDCDFNLAVEMPVRTEKCRHVSEFEPDLLIGRPTATARHCFACTAGAGSSCTGALASG